MRSEYILLGFAGLLSLVAAQTPSLANVPACAIPCLTANIAKTQCSITDLTCLCNDKIYENAVTACVLQSCTKREALAAKAVSAEQCNIKPRSRARKTTIISFTCLGVGLAFFLSRVVSRLVFKVDVPGLDDLFLGACVVCIICATVAVYEMILDGFGRDIWTVNPNRIDNMLIWYWIAEICYIWASGFAKTSLCFFLLRIFSAISTRRAIYAVLAVQVATSIAFTFNTVFQCSPVSYNWKYWDGERHGHCNNLDAGAWSLAGVNIAIDIVLLAIPIPELWRLNMNKAKKFYTMTLFLFGFLITVVSCVRLQTLIHFRTDNLTYDSAPAVYWSDVEGMVFTTFLCLPTLRAFMAGVLPCWSAIQPSSTKEKSHRQVSHTGSVFSKFSRRIKGALSSGRGSGSGSGSHDADHGRNDNTSGSHRQFTAAKQASSRIRVPHSELDSYSTLQDDLDEEDGDIFEMVDKSPIKQTHDRGIV